MSKSPSSPAIPPSAAPPPVRKHHLFSLRVKFILALAFLICVVMGVVTLLILLQMRQTLVGQIINRAEAQARSLAINSVDPLISQLSQAPAPPGGMGEDINLTLMQSAQDTMKMGSEDSSRDVPSGLAPWQEQILQTSNTLNDMIEKYLWPDSQTKTSDMEYVFLLDKNLKYVGYSHIRNAAHPDENIKMVVSQETYVPPAGLNPLGDSALLTQSYQDTGGRVLYDIATPVLNTAEGRRDKIGEIHIGMNQNTITRVVRYVAVAIILTTVGILFLGIVGMTVFVTIMVKPIRLLVHGVTAIAAGNFDQNINIKRSDELGDLTDAFNNMAKSLREKEVIKGAFSKYVTKSVVDRILQHQDGLKLGGEKKVVTVFFSDIRGFTPMSEVLTAEQVVHILNEYFTAMTAIIFKYEGTLDKFMGDAIMAVYGAPIDMPDHAERAVLAAIEMSEKMKELQAKWRTEGKREVNIGIGINTGEVVVGNIGSNERMEYTAIGDNVNLTQRLESVAEKGQILISAATYERVKHKVDAVMLDPIKVKGKTEKVVAYSVQGLKS